MPIYGPNGEILSTNKPITREIAVVTIRDRYSSYPSQGLTPERLARIFKEADQGDIYRQMELFEEMEEKDTHLFSVLQTRKVAVQGLEWEILPYSDSRADKKAAALVQEVMEFEGFEDAVLDLLDAIGKGFSVCEIMWAVEGGRALVKELRWRHQKKFRFGDQDELRLLTESDPAVGMELPPNKFVYHRYKARSGHPSRAGLLRVCAWMYLFKNYDIKDWVTFAEVYGMPIRVGKYGANASKEDKDALVQALINIGSDAAGIISKDTEIEFVEAVKSSNDVHKTLAEFCNAEISKAVLGQTLTTEVGERGSYAASKTHGEVRQDIKEADCKALAESLRRDLFRPIVRFNLGEGPRLPYIKFKYEPPEDMERTAKIYSIVIKDIGLPVSAEHVYERFGIPAPREGETVLSPPAGAVPLAMKDMIPLVLENRPPGFTQAQRQVDSLADGAVQESLPIFKALLAPLLQLIERAGSLEELKRKLPEAYAGMDTAELEDLLARAMFVADLYGRWAAGV